MPAYILVNGSISLALLSWTWKHLMRKWPSIAPTPRPMKCPPGARASEVPDARETVHELSEPWPSFVTANSEALKNQSALERVSYNPNPISVHLSPSRKAERVRFPPLQMEFGLPCGAGWRFIAQQMGTVIHCVKTVYLIQECDIGLRDPMGYGANDSIVYTSFWARSFPAVLGVKRAVSALYWYTYFDAISTTNPGFSIAPHLYQALRF
ncbi:uncharacterized protein EV420DRAFT_1482191 [Desarmillaria tabescens]|uniref:Uncharacterized protein n=1 Tax=Armillaria tabescens TaxID=1929756 RepID=A0AA39MZP3_ARMTA|nr:uncharacterized protein EV420DRAFT_1482191 [Desarmillaria tabescens]KAK0452103.1 hypothetical protein EV420DRAFT_1482191 [Desarmillaria tabescens]